MAQNQFNEHIFRVENRVSVFGFRFSQRRAKFPSQSLVSVIRPATKEDAYIRGGRWTEEMGTQLGSEFDDSRIHAVTLLRIKPISTLTLI